MKRSQRTQIAPHSTGCPDCHKKAKALQTTETPDSGGVTIEYTCSTYDCHVDTFTVTRYLQ